MLELEFNDYKPMSLHHITKNSKEVVVVIDRYYDLQTNMMIVMTDEEGNETLGIVEYYEHPEVNKRISMMYLTISPLSKKGFKPENVTHIEAWGTVKREEEC